jgi:hypothetical protein
MHLRMPCFIHSVKGARDDVRGKDSQNALIQPSTGADQFLCDNRIAFNNLVMHTEEGIGEDPSSS